jgi:hypothetical protein
MNPLSASGYHVCRTDQEGLVMPEPILISIAAALAAKSVHSVYDLVKRKFHDRKEARAALVAAEGKAPESAEVRALAAELERAAAADPQFATELRHQWQSFTAQHTGHRSVNNDVSGTVNGQAVQARTIKGGINIGR